MSSNSSPKKNLASRYLEAIGSPQVLTSPLKQTSKSNTTPSHTYSLKSSSKLSNLKENENPFKSASKPSLDSSPDSPVKRLIKMKEKDTVDNKATDFIPIPDVSPIKFSGFTRSTDKTSNSPSKSEIITMGKINSAISNSPSLKNLNKLRTIENKLRVKGTNRVESVSGLQGRVRLAKEFSSKNLNNKLSPNTKIPSSTWMDSDRKGLQAYEYLCRISEIKNWIESCLDEKIELLEEDSIAEFQEYLKNGIILAKLTKAFDPSTKGTIYYGDNDSSKSYYKNKSGLYFKFTENIVLFLSFLRRIHVPEMFIFETTDLFEMKNFPKVIFCLHALSYMLFGMNKAPQLEKLEVQDLYIDERDVKNIQIKIRGLKLPNFDNIDDGVRVNVGDNVQPLQLVGGSLNEPAVVPQQEISDDDYDEEASMIQGPETMIADTSKARSLFKEYSDKIQVDIDEIHEKYIKLISKENSNLLSSFALTSSTTTPIPSAATDTHSLVQLQAVARGSLLRYVLFVNNFMLKVFTPDIIKFQSIIRGILIRTKKQQAYNSLTENTRSLSVLQAVLKNRKRDDKYSQVRSALLTHSDEIVELQSVIRGGALLREKSYQNRRTLLRQTNQIIKLQSLIRGTLVRLIEGYESKRTTHVISKPMSNIQRLQELIHSKEEQLNNFAAIARGKLVRDEIISKKRQLQKSVTSIIKIQSGFRGVLIRFYHELLNDDITEHLELIIGLQSMIRGIKVRNSIQERQTWFRRPENVAKIIKIQSYFRTSRASKDYKSLINSRDPPLAAVRNFIQLLDDSATEVEDEASIQRYKEQIVKETKRIEQWEQDLNQLGIKMQLLKKNKISLNELITFKDNHLNLSEYSHNLNDSLNRSLGSDPNKLVTKSVKNLTDLYEKLLYLMQCKPEYFGRLLRAVDEGSTAFQLSSGTIEDWVLKTFNFNALSVETSTRPTREEFLVMKLILFATNEFFHNLDDLTNLKKFVRSRQSLGHETIRSWESLLMSYINLPQQRLLAKNLLSDCILRVSSDQDSSYEPNPTNIYKDLIERKHNEHNGITLKSIDDLKTLDPIDDSETRDQFVKNLSELREASYDIMKLIGNLIDKLPVFIRCIAKEIYVQLKRQFPGESERFYLSTVGSIIMKSYILPLFIKPENYGINLSNVSPDLEVSDRIRSNLIQVAKVLNQLVLMRPFNSQNEFLQPLNPFVEEFIEGIRQILKDLIAVEPIEETYDMTLVYDDVASNEKPKLELTKDEIAEILQLVSDEVDVMAPERNNYIRFLLFEIEELESWHAKIPTEKGAVMLNLQPITESVDPQELEAKTLLLEVKRFVKYILRVQDGEDLLDLLLSEITPNDELKFNQIMKAEKKSIDNIELDTVMERKALNDIHNSTFPQVKKHAIQLILELEQLGVITRTDGYQTLLNEIALDIKGKRSQKEERDRQLKTAIETLTKLKQKERTCSKMYSEYIKDIDLAMYKLHNQSVNKKKPLFSKYFSKQYYYQRELKKKKGYLPKFGTFKYSSRYLMDHKVLLEFSNSNKAIQSKLNKINFIFSCEKQSEFIIDICNNSLDIVGLEKISLDDLLNLQYDHKDTFSLFDGGVLMDTNNFVSFIFRKFYEVDNTS